MLELLQLVQGAVSEKDFVPSLTHFAFIDGKVIGYNGRVSIEVPCKAVKDLHCTVPAERFLAAIKACKSEPFLQLVPPSLLVHDQLGFTANLPVGDAELFPRMETLDQPKAKKLAPDKSRSLLAMLRNLQPFIGEDASRPWCTGVYFMGALAAATNNVLIAVGPSPFLTAMDFILPVFAVDELLRIGLEPSRIVVAANAVRFILEHPRYGRITLQSLLVEGSWPKSPMELIAALHKEAKMTAIPEQLRDYVEALVPLCQDRKAPVIEFEQGSISTPAGTVRGARDLPGWQHAGRFRAEPLLTMLASATHADWSLFPRVPWKGPHLEGALVGLLA